MHETAMERAVALLTDGVTCAVVNGGRTETSNRPGIAPMMGWLAADPALLKGAAVADRVIGRAAALLMVHGGAVAVYGAIVSEPAAACLAHHGVPCAYGRLVPRIKNREGTGLCPMESAVLEVDDPAEAHRVLQAKVAELMKK